MSLWLTTEIIWFSTIIDGLHIGDFAEKSLEISLCMKHIEDFDKYLNNLRNNYNKFWSYSSEFQFILTGRWEQLVSTHWSKRLHVDNILDLENSYHWLYNEIIDSIISRLNKRSEDCASLIMSPYWCYHPIIKHSHQNLLKKFPKQPFYFSKTLLWSVFRL